MPLKLDEAYEVLGLAASASEEDVRKAYKKLALKTHPDKNPDDPEASKKFLRISEAYKRITDPDSFRDEDGDGDEFNEEDMTAMFSSMFADVMGSFGFDYGHMNGSIPSEVFEMMEQMMMHEVMGSMMSNGAGGPSFMGMDQLDSDDEEEFIRDMLIFESLTGSKSGKANKKKASRKKPSNKKKNSASTGDDEWETDDSDDDSKLKVNSKSAKNNVLHNLKYFMEEDDDEDYEEDDFDDLDIMAAMMMQMGMDLPGGSGMGDMDLEELMMYGMLGGDGRGMQPRGSGKKKSSAKASSKKLKPSQARSKKVETKSKSKATDASIPDAREPSNNDKADGSKVDITANTSNNSKLNAENNTTQSSKSTCFKADGKQSNELKNNSSANPISAIRTESAGLNENNFNSNLSVALGNKVLVQNRHTGTVAYVGDVHYAKGLFVGVVMDNKHFGKNHGVIKGKEYFKCSGTSTGLMVPIADVKKI